MSVFRRLSERDEREWRNKHFGVVVAVVSNNKHPNGKYMVKVRFPWLQNGDQSGSGTDGYSGSEESDWCRVSTIMAGNGRGWFCLPEVGDEVLVAFEHGDFARPYIIGHLWNGTDAATLDNKDGKNNNRQFKSRSGHTLTFCDDKDHGESVLLKTNGKAQIFIDDKNKKIDIKDHDGNNWITIDGQNNKVLVTSNDKIAIKATGDLTIDADNITMTAKSNFTVKASSNVDIKASSNFTLKAGGQGTVQSGSTLTVKGSQVNIN